MSYSEKLKDPRWQRKRLEVMQRDNFTCRDCGSTKATLHVHHCFYQRGAPWNTDKEFLLTLCDRCHESRQADEDTIKEHLLGGFSHAPARVIRTYADFIRAGGALEIRKKKT